MSYAASCSGPESAVSGRNSPWDVAPGIDVVDVVGPYRSNIRSCRALPLARFVNLGRQQRERARGHARAADEPRRADHEQRAARGQQLEVDEPLELPEPAGSVMWCTAKSVETPGRC